MPKDLAKNVDIKKMLAWFFFSILLFFGRSIFGQLKSFRKHRWIEKGKNK